MDSCTFFLRIYLRVLERDWTVSSSWIFVVNRLMSFSNSRCVTSTCWHSRAKVLAISLQAHEQRSFIHLTAGIFRPTLDLVVQNSSVSLGSQDIEIKILIIFAKQEPVKSLALPKTFIRHHTQIKCWLHDFICAYKDFPKQGIQYLYIIP